MRFSNSNYDTDYIRKIQKEFDSQQIKQKPVVVKLPCGHGSLEITETRDQILICNTCFKRVLFTYVPVAGKSRLIEDRK